MANSACDNQKSMAERRKRTGMGVYDFSLMVGMQGLRYWNIECDLVEPTAEELRKIEDALASAEGVKDV